MYKIIKQKYSKKIGQFIIYIAIFLSGFGIYLGRYLRFNSWDILQNPMQIIKSIFAPIINPMQHPKTWGITIGYGLFFSICFLLFTNFNEFKKSVF